MCAVMTRTAVYVFDKYHFAINTFSGSAIMCVGDIAQQNVERYHGLSEGYDWSRTGNANRDDRQHSGIGSAHLLPIAGQPISSQRRVHDSQKDIHRPNGVLTTQHRFVHLRVGFLGT
ncbi:hypothetical protein ACI65C_001705 [Semiaphis heraclei]